MTGAALGLIAVLLGGASTPLPEEVGSKIGVGLDWFLLDLLVMTLVFVPVERLWPLHPQQGTFRPEWTTDAFYFVSTHLPAQLITFVMLLPATMASKWLAIPALMKTVGSLPLFVQLPMAIVVADFSQYATHRAFHKIPFLWRFHAIHHSIKTMDWIAGSRSHFVDILITRGLILIPMTLRRFFAGRDGRLSHLRVVSRHVLPHGFPSACALARATLRDGALSPLASRGASRSGRRELRHPSAVHRSSVRNVITCRKTRGPIDTVCSGVRCRPGSSLSSSRHSNGRKTNASRHSVTSASARSVGLCVPVFERLDEPQRIHDANGEIAEVEFGVDRAWSAAGADSGDGCSANTR